jgi:hypothetical protein
MRRIAVLVGANDPPPDAQALHFARDDAQDVADVLTRVGGFAPADVHLLLDPRPAELLTQLDGVAQAVSNVGGDALFVFYYSGHSDGQALFPHGEPVSLADVRARIERLGARIRVGVLDTCHGGSWTHSKGLSVGPPLPVADLMNVDTEGTALVSSSSGFEDAHEADAVHGSFFTHYFTAGLRGAADREGDGNVTLQEAFDYAKERTVRDSARLAKTPQHPSFELTLRGRQDIVLTVLSSSTSALSITAARAPIEVIQLPSGVTVADAPTGPAPVRIALPPGKYLVRSVADGRTYTKEVEVRSGETVALTDGQLEAVGNDAIAMKGDDRRRPMELHVTPPARWWELQVLAGVSDWPYTAHVVIGSGNDAATAPTSVISRNFALGLGISYGITDRLAVTLPGLLEYRIGDEDGVELVARGGLSGLANYGNEGWGYTVGAGLGLRVPVGPSQALVATSSASYWWVDHPSFPHSQAVSLNESIGFVRTFGDVVTLHLGVALNGYDLPFIDLPAGWPTSPGVHAFVWSSIGVGSVQTLGFRRLPLVAIHLTPKLSLDLAAAWNVGLSHGDVSDSYMGGFTWMF